MNLGQFAEIRAAAEMSRLLLTLRWNEMNQAVINSEIADRTQSEAGPSEVVC